ncbi:hypothetical protein [Pantoea anthophila]|uniref:hypothetical protein n=1 Tax=Pantoea anthophila TaxID=470931 RepID=UPI000614C993|nr:hypothetical protein [Pantoea anthophila]KKB02688.1 pmgC [Pantoea anthophila]
MTPVELLEAVKARFTTLLVDEEALLTSLLRQALGVYQDRAGVPGRKRIEKTGGASLPFPSDYLSLVNVNDFNGALVYAHPYDSTIELELTGREKWPFTLLYFRNIRDCDYEQTQLPADITGLLEDYLEVLIAIPNVERLRRLHIAGKFDASFLPDEATLHQRKTDLEMQISASRAIIPAMSTW